MIYVALLRGINVSGKHLIKMEELRSLFIGLGYTDVQTYIQSGNVVFKGSELPQMEHVSQIQAAIKARFGYDIPTLVLSAADLKRIHAANPYLRQSGINPKTLYITILSAAPDPEVIAGIQFPDYGTDSFVIQDFAVYLHCPQGAAETKLTNSFWERKLKRQATTRNLNTIRYLADLVTALTD
ncbi:MAG: hypothetical protein CVU48_04200 [Candidatus Cloacimonetes bacterium HGW-Cloacimonetes-1]|nr:MAG: hypothetical protein CVU48_04200 [Candidatus Cloacimonetes bacterium HGW-Cloacimonetes-1]